MSQKLRQNQLFDAFLDLTSKKETIQSWIMREDEGALCEVKSIKNVITKIKKKWVCILKF